MAHELGAAERRRGRAARARRRRDAGGVRGRTPDRRCCRGRRSRRPARWPRPRRPGHHRRAVGAPWATPSTRGPGPSAIATLIGVPLGLAIGASQIGALLSRFTIDFLRPIPSVALIPHPGARLRHPAVAQGDAGACSAPRFRCCSRPCTASPTSTRWPRTWAGLRHGLVGPAAAHRAAELRPLPGDRPAHLGVGGADPGGHGRVHRRRARGSARGARRPERRRLRAGVR